MWAKPKRTRERWRWVRMSLVSFMLSISFRWQYECWCGGGGACMKSSDIVDFCTMRWSKYRNNISTWRWNNDLCVSRACNYLQLFGLINLEIIKTFDFEQELFCFSFIHRVAFVENSIRLDIERLDSFFFTWRRKQTLEWKWRRVSILFKTSFVTFIFKKVYPCQK